VLEQGRKQEIAITEALNLLMRIGVSEGVMPEFDRLTEQLGEVQAVIKQALDKLT